MRRQPYQGAVRSGISAGSVKLTATTWKLGSNQFLLRRVLLVSITLLFGLHLFRIFIPTVTWYLSRYLSLAQVALYAFATFALTLLAPLVRRWFGERGGLALSAGGLALVRLVVQLLTTPLANLVLATAGLALLGWFIPIWRQSVRNCPSRSTIPVLAIAFPLALLLDTASRSLLLSYDLAWHDDWNAILAVVALVGLALILLRKELQHDTAGESAEEFSSGYTLAMVRLGLWFYLTVAITHNPSVLVASTGWSESSAHLVVIGLALLNLLVYVRYARPPALAAVMPCDAALCRFCSATESSRASEEPVPGGETSSCPNSGCTASRRRGLLQRGRLTWSILGSALLVGALALLFSGVGPGWLWLGLASLNSWAALGNTLSHSGGFEPGPAVTTAGESVSPADPVGAPEPARASGTDMRAITFITLVTMLITITGITEFDLLWITPIAGGMLTLLAAGMIRSQRGRAAHAASMASAPHEPARGAMTRDRRPKADWSKRIGLAMTALAAGLMIPISFWGSLRYSPQLADSAKVRPLRVMTYNIHHGIDADWRMDLSAITRVIALEDPDVIVLNEVNRGRASNGFVDTLTLISRRLRMSYVFGANQRDGLYGNAVLSRYRIVKWSNTRYRHNASQPRGLLRVVIDAPGGPVTLLATHLAHRPDDGQARAEQIAEVLEVWAGAPRTVFLGDLNAEPQAEELQAIYAAGFVDVLAQTGLDDVFTFWDPQPSRRLDFIFLTPDLPLIKAWVVPSRASDHLPVLAEIGP